MVKLNSEFRNNHVSYLLTKYVQKKMEADGIRRLPDNLKTALESYGNVSINANNNGIGSVIPRDNEIDYGYMIASLDDIFYLHLTGQLIYQKDDNADQK